MRVRYTKRQRGTWFVSCARTTFPIIPPSLVPLTAVKVFSPGRTRDSRGIRIMHSGFRTNGCYYYMGIAMRLLGFGVVCSIRNAEIQEHPRNLLFARMGGTMI